MKPITINVSEPIYREFQEYAKRKDRKTSELIREAMEQYRDNTISGTQGESLRNLRPVPVGKVLRPLVAGEDVLDEMIPG